MEGVASFCETLRLAFMFAKPRDVDFVNCEAETSKLLKCDGDSAFRVLYLSRRGCTEDLLAVAKNRDDERA